MAMRPDRMRIGERGFSLVEALVIIMITAMLALLLLPLVSRAAQRNFAVADRAIDGTRAANAEAQFRAVLEAAEQRVFGERVAAFAGRVDNFVLYPSAAQATACPPAAAGAPLRLRVVRDGAGGSLVCEAAGETVSLLAWRDGVAQFAYSADGAAWVSAWTEGAQTQGTRFAPLVRFTFAPRAGRPLVWVARAGASEAMLTAGTAEAGAR